MFYVSFACTNKLPDFPISRTFSTSGLNVLVQQISNITIQHLSFKISLLHLFYKLTYFKPSYRLHFLLPISLNALVKIQNARETSHHPNMIINCPNLNSHLKAVSNQEMVCYQFVPYRVWNVRCWKNRIPEIYVNNNSKK